jgi:tetratricopeptide (TPR) repeat protein
VAGPRPGGRHDRRPPQGRRPVRERAPGLWQGADDEACCLHGRSLDLARRLGDRTTIALALCGLARVALREDLDWARALCEEALQTVQDTDDTVGRSNALHVLGVAAQMRGDLRQARDLMTQRIELARKLGDFAMIGAESSNLSMVERQLGNLARAEQLAREALQIAEQRGDQWAIPYSLNGLAAVAVETGEFERAATLLAAAAGLQDQQGNAWPPDEAPHFKRSRGRRRGTRPRPIRAGVVRRPADAIGTRSAVRPRTAPDRVRSLAEVITT